MVDPLQTRPGQRVIVTDDYKIPSLSKSNNDWWKQKPAYYGSPGQWIDDEFDYGATWYPQQGGPLYDMDAINQAAGSYQSDVDKLLEALLAGGGSGRGGGYSDPYAGDYLKLAQDEFAHQQQVDAWSQQRTEANDRWNQAMDERDYALAVGDLTLAQKKQDDANYWKSVDNQIAQQEAAADRASAEARSAMSANASMFGSAAAANASMFGASTSAKARIQEAEISAAIARQNSENNLRIGLANARNEEQRNAVLKAWNEDQAAIARMEDETRRNIAEKQLGIDRYQSETARFGEYSNAQQKQNELIAELARSPRDLFGAFFLQRGITPDFDAIAQGNAQVGSPLTASSAMDAFVPQYGLPDDVSIGNSESGNVGAATRGLQLDPNNFIEGGTGLGNDGGFTYTPGAYSNMADFGYTPISAPTVSGGSGMPSGGFINAAAPGSAMQTPQVDVNPAGKYGGVPVAALKPGMNLATVGGPDITGSHFDFPVYRDQAKTQAIGPDELIQGGTQVWVDYPGGGGQQIPFDAGDGNSGGGQLGFIKQANRGGMVRDPMAILGDSRGRDPESGGAKPEVLLNPTGAPFGVIPSDMLDFGVSRGNRAQVALEGGGGMENPSIDPRLIELILGMGANAYNKGTMEANRYATGTGNFGASLWVPESTNPHVQDSNQLPYWMKTLYDNNVPLPPQLISSVTGGSSSPNNFANAFTSRGGGVAPSLQTLGNQTLGETELFRGYTEGPVGLSATDLIDFLGKPTQNLGTAQRSRGGVNGI